MIADLHNLINKKLAVFNRVDLPNIGSLTVWRTSASVNYQENHIAPPTAAIKFNSDKDNLDPFYFVDMGSSIYGEDQSDALHHLMLDAFEKGESYIIEDLGQFKSIDGQVVFEQDEDTPHLMPFKVLKPVQFVPISRSHEFALRHQTVGSTKVPTGRRVRSWKLWLAATLVLLNVGLIAYALNYQKFKSSEKVPVNLPEDRINIKPEEKEMPTLADSFLMDSKAIDSAAIDIPTEDTPPEDNIDALPEDTSVNFQSFNSFGKAEGIEDTPKKSPNQDNSPVDAEKPSNEVQSAEDKLRQLNQQGRDCVLVLGAFGNGDNVTRMRADLEARGFSVYTQAKGTLTRVGIYLPCESGDRSVDLGRQAMDSGAWLLKIR